MRFLGLPDCARSLGFARRTGVELPERTGLIPDRDWDDNRYGKRGWTKGHILNVAIGQGEVLATPLQLAGLMATVARRGRPASLHLVQRLGDE